MQRSTGTKIRDRCLSNLTIICFAGIAAFDVASGLEHWPFGTYPMYSLLYARDLTVLRLYAVTAQGETLLRDDRDFPPFDQSRLTMALSRIASEKESEPKLREALTNLLALHSTTHPGTLGLRLYAASWTLRSGLQGTEAPDTKLLLAEVSR